MTCSGEKPVPVPPGRDYRESCYTLKIEGETPSLAVSMPDIAMTPMFFVLS